MVAILSAVLTDGLAAVEAACAEAMAQGVHSSMSFSTYLLAAVTQDRPVTIMTPEALRLQHASHCDCNRYDRLRRSP